MVVCGLSAGDVDDFTLQGCAVEERFVLHSCQQSEWAEGVCGLFSEGEAGPRVSDPGVWGEAVDELYRCRGDGDVFGLLCCSTLPDAASVNDVWWYADAGTL